MQAWKPLLIILPAGLLLGMVGGHYARPEIVQHSDAAAWQTMFETRAERSGTPARAQPEDATYYSGGYSYPPYLDDRMLDDDREIVGWRGPSFADWPEYKPAPLPSAAQLQAQLAERDDALAQRAWSGSAVDQDGGSAADTAEGEGSSQPGASGAKLAAVATTAPPAPPTAEPRTPDGELPAIW